jgi:hypothetical protein
MHRTTRPALRCTLAVAVGATLLVGCALFDREAAGRIAVSLSTPAGPARPAWLQDLVAQMDAKAFPDGGPLVLKLSYELGAPAPKAAAACAVVVASVNPR